MATPTLDWTIPQGEDFIISMIYKEGDPTPVPINLAGWSARMDIKAGTTRLATLNSVSIQDVDQTSPGDQTDSVLEISLDSGGGIVINIDRSLTLPPSGILYQQMNLVQPVTSFNYDIFLRNTSNKQKKILRGTITIEGSSTLWQ